MIELVLRHLAFRRSPRSKARAALFALAFGTMGLIAGSSLAGPTGPTIVDAQTLDTSGDGWIDAIVVTFDTPMDVAVQHPTGFVVEGYELRTPPAGFESQWACPSGNCALPTVNLQLNLVPRLEIPGGDTAATPKVTFTQPAAGGPRASGTLAPAVSGERVPKDAAKPALVTILGADYGQPGIFKDAADRLDLVFSEPVRLAGATNADRHLNLERAVKFSNGAGCQSVDGDGVNVHNFPRAGTGASATDPIVLPAKPATGNLSPASKIIRVMMPADAGTTGTTGTTAASNIPGVCKVGIDAANTGYITDASNAGPNSAASQDSPGVNANRRDINVAPSELLYVAGKPGLSTRDLVPDPGNGAPKGDGKVDAIEVIFDQEIIDETVTNALTSLFTVTLGAQTATIDSVTTTAGAGTPADSSIFLNISGVEWDGQAKPKVSFDGSSCALRTKIPTPTYHACAGSFGLPDAVEALDKVAPVLKTAQTVDQNTDGVVDRVVLGFNEPVAAASTVAGWTIGGTAASVIQVDATDGKIVRLDYAGGSTPNSGATPAVTYTLQNEGGTVDADGNQIGAGTLNATDGAAPVLIKATSFDLDGNGKIDAATLQFSEAVNEALTTPADYTIGGAATYAFGNSPIDPPGSGDDLVTVLSNSQPIYTGHIGAGYVGSTLADLASIAVPPKTIEAGNVFDAAGPVATITTDPASPFKAQTIAVKVTFTEPMDSAIIPTVKVGDKDVTPLADIDHANGFRNADLSRWDGAVELTSAECGAPNGCALDVTLDGGKDPSANDTLDGAVLSVVLDAVGPDAATNETVTAVQKPGYASIALNTIGSATTQLNLTASIAPDQVNELGQTAGGSAEILKGDVSLTPVARIENIDASANQVTITTAFSSLEALKDALPEGSHVLKVKLCDGALNCATSNGVVVTADYSPVAVTLGSPNSGVLQGNSQACITWDGNEADTTLTGVSLRYSTDSGATYPNAIAGGLGADGSGACDGSGTAYGWTVPLINTSTLKVQVLTLDSYNNEGIAASAEDLTVQTTYVLTHGASASVIANGAPVTFSGTFKGNSVPVTGRGIIIQRKIRGTSVWSNVATVLTNGSGAYSWTGKPGMNADWRSVSVAGNGYPSVTSGTSYVAVRVVLNFVTSVSSLARGQYATLSGSIVPAKRNVVVQLQMYSGGKWVKLAQTYSSSSGGYKFTYRLTTAGARTFRTYYAQQDALHAGNYSVQRSVTWR